MANQGGATAPKWNWKHTAVIFGLLIIGGAIGWLLPWRGLAWLSVLVFLTISFLVAGHGWKGMWRGIFIDERNKISLSRLQMVFWTVLVLSAFMTAALGNIAVATKAIAIYNESRAQAQESGGNDAQDTGQETADQPPEAMTFAEAMTQASQSTTDDGELGTTMTTLKDALSIAVPQELWLLMGISTTTLLATPLIRNNQTNQDPKKKEGGTDEVGTAVMMQSERSGVPKDKIATEGIVLVNKDPADARFGDIFETETVGNVDKLDIGKIQSFYFTAILLLVYAVMLYNAFRSLPVIHELPALSASMLALLGISQVGYLGSKALPTNVSASTVHEGNGQDPAVGDENPDGNVVKPAPPEVDSEQ